MGVVEIPIALSAHHLVARDKLAQLIHAIDTAQTPILLHCQYGNDRTGLASMLAVLALGQSDYASARKQLRIPLTRWGKDKTHISDTIVLYEDYCSQQHLDPNNWSQFKTWAATVYSPDAAQVQASQPAE